MPDDVLYEKLLSASLRFVSYRPRSEKEFRDFLTRKLKKRKVYDIVVIPRVIKRLTDLGYVDDEAFARWWVQSRMQFRPKGARVLILELLRKGVAKSTVAEVVSRARKSGENEKDTVKQLAQKRLSRLAGIPARERKKKLFDFLLRRGFEADLVTAVVDEVVSSEVQ